MMTKQEIMNSFLKKCDILLNGQVISRELILGKFNQFLNMSSEELPHNVGIVLHTGSPLFDAVAVVYAAISNILLNETEGRDVVRSLKTGDTVVYGEKKLARYKFMGIISARDWKTGQLKEYAVLKQGTDTNNVPVERWGLIVPYLGASSKMDGSGIKKKTGIREEFIQSVLGLETHEISAMIDTSTVIVMSPDKADWLINHIYLCFDKKFMKLLELVTASYYTENDEYFYPGNPGKTDPVLKICGNLSVARQKLMETDGNKNIGMMILGSEIVSRGITEIPMLMHRQSLQYLYISLQIDSEHGPYLLSEYDQSVLFACTKEFLLSNSAPIKARGALLEELGAQTDAVIDKEIRPKVLQGSLDWDEYRQFKRNMIKICSSDYESEDKDEFIINAYTLMRLLTMAVFKLDVMEKMIESGRINANSPSDLLKKLRKELESFPPHLHEAAQDIAGLIEDVYLQYSDAVPKEDYLRAYLAENHDKHIALIVPKAYFSAIAREIGLYSIMDDESFLSVTTANRFDNTRVYDAVLCAGDLSGRRFDPFRTCAARDIIPFLYKHESNLFKLKMKKAQAVEKMYNAHTAAGFIDETEYEDIIYDDGAEEEGVDEINKMDDEINQYIQQLNDLHIFRSFGDYSGSQSTMASIIAVGTFESGHKIFFSQMYKAYVLDEETGEVKEKSVDQLHEGDSLVFTQNNEETKDIIDDILQKLISDGRLDSGTVNDYYMSKQWKKALIAYMKDNGLSAGGTAKKMIANGVMVQEITIRCWLDEDAHTIGPRNAESIQQIGLLVNDQDMFENYTAYHEACGRIRNIRQKILRMMGRAIIRKIGGKQAEDGGMFDAISDRIDSLSMILKLETLVDVSKQVPINVINRPFMMKE